MYCAGTAAIKPFETGNALRLTGARHFFIIILLKEWYDPAPSLQCLTDGFFA